MDVAGLVVAIFAALIALAALVLSKQALDWQKKQDEARVTPDVAVKVEHSVKQPPGPMTWDELAYVATITVINEGETTEYLRGLWVEAPESRPGRFEPAGFPVEGEADGDVELRPHQSEARDFDLTPALEWPGFIVRAVFASGKEFQSDPQSFNAGYIRTGRG